MLVDRRQISPPITTRAALLCLCGGDARCKPLCRAVGLLEPSALLALLLPVQERKGGNEPYLSGHRYAATMLGSFWFALVGKSGCSDDTLAVL